jgi:hypothetical protein
MFEDYAIEEYDSRSAMLRATLAAFSVVNIHLDAWRKYTCFSFINLLKRSVA